MTPPLSGTPTPSVELAPLTPAFAPLAAALHDAGFDDAWSADAIIRLLDVPGAFGFLAYAPAGSEGNRQDAPLGFVLVQAVLDEAEITTIVVAPPARRRGVARALMAAVMARLQAAGVVRLFLEVAEDNPGAIALYRRCRFSEVGRRPGYYRRKTGADQTGQAVDALVMACDVDHGMSQ